MPLGAHHNVAVVAADRVSIDRLQVAEPWCVPVEDQGDATMPFVGLTVVDAGVIGVVDEGLVRFATKRTVQVELEPAPLGAVLDPSLLERDDVVLRDKAVDERRAVVFDRGDVA